VCDAVSNCATAGPVAGNKVDRKVPSISVVTPSAGAVYLFRQPVASNSSCSDGGSGVASCTGTVPSGANVPTTTAGARTFAVTARDAVGNVTPTTRVAYTVRFTFQGFFYPRNQPVLNVVQAGRIVPVAVQRHPVCECLRAALRLGERALRVRVRHEFFVGGPAGSSHSSSATELRSD
jgi:hypothetical protein